MNTIFNFLKFHFEISNSPFIIVGDSDVFVQLDNKKARSIKTNLFQFVHTEKQKRFKFDIT